MILLRRQLVNGMPDLSTDSTVRDLVPLFTARKQIYHKFPQNCEFYSTILKLSFF